MLSGRWWLVPILIVGWIALFFLAAWGITRKAKWQWLVAGLVLSLAWPLLVAPVQIGVAAWSDLSNHGFGFVGGSTAEGDALCDWLHRHIQSAAGLPLTEPLTFGMLEHQPAKDGNPTGIRLEMITTNLSLARPMRVPRELDGYAFARHDLDGLLPPEVIAWLQKEGRIDGDVIQLAKADQVPVLLGFRLSLSFPLLLTALRLRAAAPETLRSDPLTHWFSDGGIASNFPVHFFDEWMPSRPTFALSFAPFPVDPDGRVLHDESDIGVPPGPNEPKLPRWVDVKGLGGFGAQILETMQNWRDTLQSEIPGFRDRVYEARLDKDAGEGGLNLGMDSETIQRLQQRGGRVGEAILKTFDWNQHFYTRYTIAMQQVELGLLGPLGAAPGGVYRSFSPWRGRFSAGNLEAKELFGRDAAWLAAAGDSTWTTVTAAQRWAAFGHYLSDTPRPQPVMRIIPGV